MKSKIYVLIFRQTEAFKGPTALVNSRSTIEIVLISSVVDIDGEG